MTYCVAIKLNAGLVFLSIPALQCLSLDQNQLVPAR